jgi:hypothetical protein
MPGIWGQSAREKRVRWPQLARFIGDQRIAFAGRSRFNDSGKRSSIASGREDVQNLRGACMQPCSRLRRTGRSARQAAQFVNGQRCFEAVPGNTVMVG